MKSLPWKVIVLADLGLSETEPSLLPPGEGWPEGWRGKIELPLPDSAGRPTSKTFVLDVSGLDDLAPPAIKAALAAAGLADAPAAAVDAVLHNAAFQRTETAWRGLLTLRAHAGAAAQVFCLSTRRAELLQAMQREVFLESPEPWSLLVLDFDFSHKGSDLDDLQAIARMARILEAPLVAGAAPALFDLRYFAHLGSVPNTIERLSDAAHAAWRAFCASPDARWVVLTVNRWLTRVAWSGDHAEVVDEGRPETLAFGRGAWLVASAVARSVATHGHALDLAGARGGRFDHLPSRAYPQTINETIQLAAETPLEDMKYLELTRSGVTPLVGVKRSASLVLPQVSTTFQLAPGKLTYEGTLAYQFTAARLDQYVNRFVDQLGPSERAQGAGAAAALKAGVEEFMRPILGESPGDAVVAEVVQVDLDNDRKGEALRLLVAPPMPFEGKQIAFELLLPLA